ncbi:unnamed protein product [Peronospora farinosa]|uniref:Uncharacterized protein n=1 Tax=Peronospora farinosa TaxID=134698 RepID=A0AAV0UXZ0_9STRA|nr:unnamed protein product [Peronospora farinosa]CAI5740241.1 unnamed protein product [Peronospora farinosa]
MNALAQELKVTVECMRDIQVRLIDMELAFKEDQEEVESYTDEIADCCDRIEAIDEFVREMDAGNIPAMGDVASVMSNMAEEREEEEKMLQLLGDARTCHEEQLQHLKIELVSLQDERGMLQKKSFQIMCVFERAGIVELVARLAERSIKML